MVSTKPTTKPNKVKSGKDDKTSDETVKKRSFLKRNEKFIKFYLFPLF